MADALGPPGGVIYSSSTMTVGDATWDATRNSYLLPNLQGLNFATMRYNGMGNRYRSDSRYRALIIAHGIIAALVFLLLMPVAVFIAKFYHADGRRALRMHVSLQIISTILLTIVIVLGVLAVGSDRAFSNPHHGIGIAIYTCVLLQAIGGAIIRQTEKHKPRPYQIPMRIMLHKWFGRAVVLLGIAQVALGLTLYGSPLWLFIMYAIVVFIWMVLLFRYCHKLQYDDPQLPERLRRQQMLGQESYYNVPIAHPRNRRDQHMIAYHNDPESQNAQRPDRHDRHSHDHVHEHHPNHNHHHYLRDAALAGGAVGAYKHWRRRSHDRDDQRYYHGRLSHQHGPHTPQSASSVPSSFDEKQPGAVDSQHHGQGEVLSATPGFVAGRSMLHGQARRPSIRHSLEKPPLTPSDVPGQMPASHQRQNSPHVTFATPPHSSQASSSDMDPADRLYREQFRRAHDPNYNGSEGGSSLDGRYPGILGTLAGLTGIAAIRSRLRDRQERREQDRLDDISRIDQMNAERLDRWNVHREQRRLEEQRQKQEREQHAPASFDGSQYSSPPISNAEMHGTTPHRAAPGDRIPSGPQMPLAMNRPELQGTTAAPTTPYGPAQPHAQSRPPLAVDTNVADDSSIQASPIRLPAPPVALQTPTTARGPHMTSAVPVPVSVAGSSPAPHPTNAAPTAPNLPSAPTAAQTRLIPPAPPSYNESQANDADGSLYSGSVSMSSVRMTEPPVSVKVRIHNNERHVTMRKLNEAEIAAEQARQRRQARRRVNSMSAGVEVEPIANRSCRGSTSQARTGVGSGSMAQTASVRATSEQAPGQHAQPRGQVTSPQPTAPAQINRSAEYLSPIRNADGYSSPGTGTMSESSAFEQNRRRRRAERALQTSPQAINSSSSIQQIG